MTEPEFDISQFFDDEVETPSYKLFSPGAVALATVLGSFLAGALLIGMNYKRLGKWLGVVSTVLVCVLVIVGLVLMRILFPDDSAASNWFIPAVIFTPVMAQMFQGSFISRHRAHGGKMASLWAAGGIGVVFCAVLGGAALILFAMARNLENELNSQNLGKVQPKKVFEDTMILFEATWPLEDKNQGSWSKMRREGDTQVISFAFSEYSWDHKPIVDHMRKAGIKLANHFGRPLKIELCDKDMTPREVILIE